MLHLKLVERPQERPSSRVMFSKLHLREACSCHRAFSVEHEPIAIADRKVRALENKGRYWPGRSVI